METLQAEAPPAVAVDPKAEAEPEPQLEAAASPTDADAAKSKKKKKKKKKSRRKSLERAQSELQDDEEPQDEAKDEQQHEKEEKDEKEESKVEAEPSEEQQQKKEDNQQEDELAPPELERTSSLDSINSIKASGTRAVGSLFSRFKVGRKKPLPSRTESAAKLELVSPSPVKTAVKRLEVAEEKSLDDLPLRTKRGFFADGEQSVHVSAEKEKYDALEKQRQAEKEAEAARQSPPSSRRSSEQAQTQDEAAAVEAVDEERVDAPTDAPTAQSSDDVDKDASLTAVVDDVEVNDANSKAPAADSLPVSDEASVLLMEKSNCAEATTIHESSVESHVSSREVTVTETSTDVDLTEVTSSVVESAKEERIQEEAGSTAVEVTEPVSLELDLDLEPAEEPAESKLDQEEPVVPSSAIQDGASAVTESMDTVRSKDTELLTVKITPPTSEMPAETTQPAKSERMSPVKSLASRFEGKREQSLDSLKFRTVREFFPEERSIRVGAEKQKYEAQAQQQKLKAKAEEEAKSKYKIGSSFKSPGKDGASPAPSPELKATAVKESGNGVDPFSLSTPDAAGSRKKFSFDDGHAASDSPGMTRDGSPEAVTPVKSIASRFEGKREQSLDSLKFRTVREFFPEERSVRVGSEKQKFEAQAKQDNSLDKLKFRTVREFFPEEGQRSVHVGAEKAKFEALTRQQEEAAKAADQIKLKHSAPSPITTSTDVKSSEEAQSVSAGDDSDTLLGDNQNDADVAPSEMKNTTATEPTEENADTDVELSKSLDAITTDKPVDCPEVSSVKIEDGEDGLPQTGLTPSQEDNQTNTSPVDDGQGQAEVVTDSACADSALSGNDNDAITENSDADQSGGYQTSADEATSGQKGEKDVSSAEDGPAVLDLGVAISPEENQTSCDDEQKLDKYCPISDNGPAELDVGESVQHEENQIPVAESIIEKEIDGSAEVGVGISDEPEEMLVGEAIIEQVVEKEVLILSAESTHNELDLGEPVHSEDNQTPVDEANVEQEVEKVVSSVDIESPGLDHRESVIEDVESTDMSIDDATDAVIKPFEDQETGVETSEEHADNIETEVDIVEHAKAVKADTTATHTIGSAASHGANQESAEVEARSDRLVELDINESEQGEQIDLSSAALGSVDTSTENEHFYVQSREQATEQGQPKVTNDITDAENGPLELPTDVEAIKEPQQETKSTPRPLLTTERSFVMENDNTIETEDTVVVGERPMTDGEDEFEPQSSTKTCPADKPFPGVSSDSKHRSSSSNNISAHASKASPKLTRKVSAGSVGSAKSSSSKTTVPVPMKRASITAPTASSMAKKAAEANELHKTSQQFKKQGSASKMKGTISDTGLIKPPPVAPTVPVPMKRASITAPTASYMTRKTADVEEAHRASPPPKQPHAISKKKGTVGPTGFVKPLPAATTVPVPMKRTSITAPTASWQARNVSGSAGSSEFQSAKNHASKSKGTAGPTVPVAPKRASIMAPTASYKAKKAVEQVEDVEVAAPLNPPRNKRYSSVKSKVMEGIQSGSMHVATHKTITKEEFIAAERRKSLGSAGVKSVLDSFDRRASLSARVTIEGPPEPFMRSAVSRKKLNSTVPRYLDYENAPGYAERAQKQYERRKRLEEENAAKSERRQKELRVFFSERQQKALKLSAEEVRRGLEAHEFAKLAKESEIEVQKKLRKEKQRELTARTHSRGSSSTSSVGASSSNGLASRSSKKSSASSVHKKIMTAPVAELTELETDPAIESTIVAEETFSENDALLTEASVATVEAEEVVSTEVEETVVVTNEVEKQTDPAPAVDFDPALEHVAKKIDFDEASSDSDEKDVPNV
ncbi:adhesin-like protein [Phytophthora cinnamomi]|uniref:adhesin-like protein n=1 Tax=Phytophthora cinnamomi TaxID=4785 RepID=UPI00355A31BA|nr:adhesin-like protein [Phytophthora cinnamomi]